MFYLYIFILLLSFYYFYNLYKKEVPGPIGLPFIGCINSSIILNENTSHLELEKGVLKYGDIYEINILNYRLVIISNLEIIQQILQNRPLNFRRISHLENIAKEIGTHGVFSAENNNWKRQRKLITPAFTPIQVRNHYDNILLICLRLKNKWIKKIENEEKNNNNNEGVIINILPDLMSFTLDIISLIAFGYDLNSIEKHSHIMESLLIYMPYIHKRITTLLPKSFFKYFYINFEKQFNKSQEITKNLVYNIINDYYENNKNNNDTNNDNNTNNDNSNNLNSSSSSLKSKSFIEIILNAREKEKDQLNDSEIFANLITLLIAGQDTTANTLAWSLYYLSRNNIIQENIYNEIKNNSTYNDNFNIFTPSKHIIEKLKYTSSVIKETLRLKTPTPVLFIESNNNIELKYNNNKSKLKLKKKDITILLTRNITTQEQYFKNAKIFNPERWLEKYNNNNDKENSENNGIYNNFITNLAFGGGPRVCPGRNLSLLESNIFLSIISNEFIIRPSYIKNKYENIDNIKGTEDPNVKESLAFTMSPCNLNLRFFKRN